MTKAFVEGMVRADRPLQAYFADPSPELGADVEAAFARMAALPDMRRANVYDADRRMIWSSDPRPIGHRLRPDKTLDAALAGDALSRSTDPTRPERDADRPPDLPQPPAASIAIYVPVLVAQSGTAHAVIELHKNPRALVAALTHLRMAMALGAGVAAVLLFAALLGLVRRADTTIRRQRRQLVDSETLAVIGAMSAAVAHGVRNPLASIRSSAELMQDGDLAQALDAAADVVAQSDRLEAWVRELLAYTRPLDAATAPVPLQPLVAGCLKGFDREMQRRHIHSHTRLTADLPAVRGDALLLGQVLNSLLTNAIEALDREGQITVRGDWVRGQVHVTLSVQDSGPGMTRAQLDRIGKPFHSTKARGLGVGLALARRVIEHFGGHLEIDSEPGLGTTVRLQIPAA